MSDLKHAASRLGGVDDLEALRRRGRDRLLEQHVVSHIEKRERGLAVQFELGKKHTGTFSSNEVDQLVEQGNRWLDAGALQLVVEARESACGVGLFNDRGEFNAAFADRFADAFGLSTVMFEAPNKASQFRLLDHFGPEVHLSNVRLEEILRVEIYRRGLHSDAFLNPKLRPQLPGACAKEA